MYMPRLVILALLAAITCAPLATGKALAGVKGDSNKMDDTQWFHMPDEKIETRWYTFENQTGEKGQGGKSRFTRKGAPCTAIAKGGTLVLADIKGSGTIRRIWMTPGPRDADMLRGCKIEMFWDGSKTPAVQAPLGDFFCHSLGNMVTFENACFSSPEARSMNSFIPMPFRKSAKIQITNESPKDIHIYYDIAVTMNEKHDDNMLYFHSYWRRENYTTVRQDMTILPQVKGRGRFLGCNLGVRLHPSMRNFWWGEGEVKAYIDGDKEYPTLCGTGTEDYIGSAYGQGLFANRFQGNQYIGSTDGKTAYAYGFYRFHIPDPVYFHKDARVTIQVMGGPSYRQMLAAMDYDPSLKFMKAGDGTEYYTREELEANLDRAEVMERIDDHCATAYWYMDKAENGLPPIAGFEERIKDLP
jgi:hypothetical protein